MREGTYSGVEDGEHGLGKNATGSKSNDDDERTHFSENELKSGDMKFNERGGDGRRKGGLEKGKVYISQQAGFQSGRADLDDRGMETWIFL